MQWTLQACKLTHIVLNRKNLNRFSFSEVFLAEDSNTHRHLTEFIGLALEMAVQYFYLEAVDIIGAVLAEISKGLYDKYALKN